MMRRTWNWLAAVGCVAYFAVPASAQPANGGNKAAAAAGADANVDFSKTVVLSPADQLNESTKAIASMERGSANIRKMLEQARKERDVVKTLCLDDKLSQMDVAIRAARERRSGLEGAVKTKDAELSKHEYTILTVLRQRGDQLMAEATTCVGEDSAYVGQTKTTLAIDPNISQTEDAPYPAQEFPPSLSLPPQCVSCSL
ncbi:MAG: hypothetical protein U0174_04070 [Polyangiaceae bacterium]